MESELIRKARAFAEDVYKDRSFESRPFHNLGHTQSVALAAREIGGHTAVSDDELESALIAAWLHDIGYLEGEKEHERRAATKALELLEAWGAPRRKGLEVSDAILSTKVPQQPKSIVGKVLCDADLFYLSTESCAETSRRLREEFEAHGKPPMSDVEWINKNIEFMEGHRYHTAYGQTVLEAGKRTNIRRLHQPVANMH